MSLNILTLHCQSPILSALHFTPQPAAAAAAADDDDDDSRYLYSASCFPSRLHTFTPIFLPFLRPASPRERYQLVSLFFFLSLKVKLLHCELRIIRCVELCINFPLRRECYRLGGFIRAILRVISSVSFVLGYKPFIFFLLPSSRYFSGGRKWCW